MWFNPIMRWLLRSPLHFFISGNTMSLQYRGRQSGKQYQTPMNYWRLDGQQGRSLGTTSYRSRTWWRNLRGGAPVQVILRGRELPAKAWVEEDERLVVVGLRRLLAVEPKLGRFLHIGMDANGEPDENDLARVAQEMVFINTEIAS